MRAVLCGPLQVLPSVSKGLVAAVAVLFIVSPGDAREPVPFDLNMVPGSIVVRTAERRLYFVLGNGTALRYPVAVGRRGKQWSGQVTIDGKYIRPAWEPPPEIRREKPALPRVIAGGAANNPMGAAALTMLGGEYAIHGTNRPSSIGTYASYGCIRMLNSDVLDLFQRVQVGAPVLVLP